jgi:hypothetical protein
MTRAEYTYAIIDSDTLQTYNLSKFNNETFRYNKDRSKVIVYFNGENYDLLNIPLYSSKQIIDILLLPEWKNQKKRALYIHD